MSYGKKWSPSNAEKEKYANTMNEIDKFCKDNNIKSSFSNDSYYFSLNGKNYRISNHTIETSDAGAFNENGEKLREFYHVGNEQLICFTASKTRIIEIYNNLLQGKELDKRGKEKQSLPL
ncbi:MAG: hypothetical protein RR454_00375 [Clostridia bacterium]